MKRLRPLMIVGVLALGLAGCSGIEVVKLSDTKYPATSSDHVQVLTVRPERPFTELAVLKSDDYDAKDEEKLLRKMKDKAADLGADALLVTSAQQMGRSDRSDMDYRATAIKFTSGTTTPPATPPATSGAK